MCKTCVHPAQTSRLSSCTSSSFCTAVSLKINGMRTSALYTQFYNLLHLPLVNIVFSLNSSVKAELSTVSTAPITKTAEDKFKFVYNN